MGPPVGASRTSPPSDLPTRMGGPMNARRAWEVPHFSKTLFGRPVHEGG